MIKKILITFLLLFFCWAIYLMQVDPEAEAFFYSYPEQEREEINQVIEYWRHNKRVRIPVAGDIEKFDCWNWNNVGWNLREETETCASNEELNEIVSQNKALLDKYHLFKQEPEKPEFFDSHTLLDAHRLLGIKVYLMVIEGKLGEALSLLVGDNDFWKKRLAKKNISWIGHAINMVHLRLNFSTLPYILNTDHNYTESELAQFKNFIFPINAKDLNIEKIIRGEFELLKINFPELKKDEHPIAKLFLGAFINHSYENTQEFLENTMLPFTESCAKRLILKRRDKYNLGSPMTSFIKFGHIGILANIDFKSATSKSALKVFFALHDHNAHRKLLSFIVLLKEKNIPSSQISAFIKNNADLATNSLSGNPFIYDQEEKKISMDATECSESWSVSLSNFN